MLKLDGVHKKFKSALVAEQISVDLGPCTYGLLGRNGSGKTTLLRCITRVEKVNGGRIVYTDGDGREVKDYLDHIGYLPQNFDVFPELTAYEVLQFFANLKGYKITEAEITHLLEILNLSPQRDMTVKTLSGGMKRRLGIAQALIGDPDVLLLDEPTAGLDPEERLNFKNVIRRIRGIGAWCCPPISSRILSPCVTAFWCCATAGSPPLTPAVRWQMWPGARCMQWRILPILPRRSTPWGR